MRSNKNKILIIVLIVIAILAIVGGIFAYLFLATDVFKSGQELFAKYLLHNIEDIKEVSSIEKINQLQSKLEQSKYEENIEISFLETENSDPIAQITFDTQNDSINRKNYSILGFELENFEEKMELEYMQENEMYSIRFTNAVKQFLSVKNSNLKEFAKKLGVDEEQIQDIPDKIDFEEFSFKEIEFTEEEINTEVNKYLSLLYNNIAKEKYQKNKNNVITVDGKTITTNSYVLTLSMQDLKNIITITLETLKQDEIILGKLQKIDEKLMKYDVDSIEELFVQEIQDMLDSLKEEDTTKDTTEEITEESNIVITVYEANKQTVRIKMEQDLNTVEFDTIKQDAKKQIDITIKSMDDDKTQHSNKVSFVKENDNKLNIIFNNFYGEEQQSTNINMEITENQNNTKINTTIKQETFQINISRDVTILDEINYKVTLDDSNNIILNDKSQEQIISMFNLLGERLVVEYVEPLGSILEPLMLFTQANEAVENTNLTEAEIAAYNSKFTPYEGMYVSTSQVNALLLTVFSHNTQEAFNITDAHYVTVSGDVTLESDAVEVTKVSGSNYYNVECKMDEAGFVNEIIITEVNE